MRIIVFEDGSKAALENLGHELNNGDFLRLNDNLYVVKYTLHDAKIEEGIFFDERMSMFTTKTTPIPMATLVSNKEVFVVKIP